MAGEPTLRDGDDGPFVVRLQRALNSAGFDVGLADGLFRDRTRSQVRAFQSSEGLGVDGVVGADTWVELPTRVVRLHIKLMALPTTETLGAMVREARRSFVSVGFGIEVASVQTLPVNPVLIDLEVGTCPFPCATAPTTEQTAMWVHDDHVAENEIRAYFVRSVLSLGTALNGCCAHPPGQPGVAVAQTASQLSLGHEVGHVLGLSHVEPPGGPCQLERLMTGCGTNSVINLPADLAAAEQAIMESSPLAFRIDV
ncbi:MAG: peptidoglycan-binding protein [Ornithinibacter sp.]